MTPASITKPKVPVRHQQVGIQGAPAYRTSMQTRRFARRTFLGAALVLGAVALTRAGDLFSGPLTGKVRELGKTINSLHDVTYETLLALTGVPLVARPLGAGASQFTLKLAAVTRAPAARGFPPGAGQDYESLSLIFEGAADQPAPQSTYELEAPGQGRFLLFIVPTQPVAGLRRYQAIINRPLSALPA